MRFSAAFVKLLALMALSIICLQVASAAAATASSASSESPMHRNDIEEVRAAQSACAPEDVNCLVMAKRLTNHLSNARFVARYETVAGDLVDNGGFEDNKWPKNPYKFPKWSLRGNKEFSYINCGSGNGNVYFEEVPCPTGAATCCVAAIGATQTDAILSQKIHTTPGATYNVSFYATIAITDFYDHQLTVSFGDRVLLQDSSANKVIPLDQWVFYSYTVKACSHQTRLQFKGFNNAGDYLITNVRVIQTSAPVDSARAVCPDDVDTDE
jgi:hypothetical protein